MATDITLQWQAQITDSTDREVILGNIDILEKFALSINGGDKYTISDGKSQVTGTLSTQFNLLRTGIKNGTLKPASWKDSEPFGKITTALENVSSGKLLKRVGTAEGNITSHGKALSNYGKRIKDAEGDITDHGTRLDTAEGNITSHEETLSGYGTRISSAEDDIKKKLGISEFEKFQTGDTSWKDKMDKKVKSFASSSELDNLRTLLSNEISHWTRSKAPQPLDSYKALADLKKFEQPWEVGANADKNYIPERHIGDLCTVIGATQPDNGVSYRFVKHPDNNTYTWTKVIDNDGAKALRQHSQFVTQYEKRQKKLDEDSSAQQKALKDLLEKYNGANNTLEEQVSKLDQLGNNFAEEQRKAEERDKQYKVVVSTKGYIKDGVIVNGESNKDGTPVIVHTAHVYDNFGHEKTIEARSKLTWTINKGRTTKPVEKTVTGLVCEVSQDQFVNDGTNPHYYDIELNSTF